MNVAAWLRELGLEGYVQAFEDNDVDAQTLPKLTEADLAEIGVKSVGHRRKLVTAIARLGGVLAATDAEASQASAIPLQAEHRQLSVLYCDMVGSTTLSGRLDPEDYREVIRSFHDTCVRTVVEYGGWVANFIGDCVLAYFGWPRAHEDDAERAVRAGLALVQAVDALRTPTQERLAVRVGVATGVVVVGDLIREGPAQAQSAVGAAPDLAAQLQTLATPGQVVTDELTRRLLVSGWVMRPLGERVLKGIARPVAVYEVSGERVADSRFDARQGQQLSPMIGRDRELALLMERWTQAQAGEGLALLLVGEAGIGKSRLVRALLDECAAQVPHGLVRWQCSPHHSGSALWPVIQRLGRSAGLQPEDSPDAALNKLEAVAGGSEASSLYATLLGLNGTQRYGPLEMTPQMLRERTLELMVEQLFETAERQPLLLVVEDAHWIDPTTLELIERCLEKIDKARMLVLITSRPDHQPNLGAHPSVTRLSLNRLSRASVQAMVERLAGDTLEAQTLATIVAQTDGVPLFIEELTKAVLETGETAIPASLHGSLMARLDHLPEVKEVAQAASCIGREFDLSLLQAVVDTPETVGPAIDKLGSAELIFRRGEHGKPRYTFKHALVQEAAYESLLRAKRQAIHARVLQVLEAERPDTPLEILAHHAEGARLVDKAIDCWSRAGNDALARSAYGEATSFFDSAIALVCGKGDGVEQRGQELDLQIRLGQAHIAARGLGAEPTGKAFHRAHELLASVSRMPARTLGVQYGLCTCYLTRGEVKKAMHVAVEALAEARADGLHEHLLTAHRLVALTSFYLGRFTGARRHFTRVMGLMRRSGAGERTQQFGGMDPSVAALCNLALVLCVQGFFERGHELVAQARRAGAAQPNAYMRAHMHLYCALRTVCARDSAAVAADVDLLADLALRHRLATYKGYALCLQGWLALESGRPAEDAVTAYERGHAQLAAVNARLLDASVFRSGLARALAACGRQQDALRTMQQALGECERNAQEWYLAELWRVRGDIALREPLCDEVQAVRCFERALAVARSQGAKLWELRAAARLARLLADQGEPARALNLLAPAYGAFTEGFDTLDLREARALLGELRALSRPVGHHTN